MRVSSINPVKHRTIDDVVVVVAYKRNRMNRIETGVQANIFVSRLNFLIIESIGLFHADFNIRTRGLKKI